MKRKTFICYSDWNEFFDKETPLDAIGELFLCILEYQNGNKEARPQNPGMKAVFNFMRMQFETDAAKYAEVCQKRTDAINKRWNRSRGADQAAQTAPEAPETGRADQETAQGKTDQAERDSAPSTARTNAGTAAGDHSEQGARVLDAGTDQAEQIGTGGADQEAQHAGAAADISRKEQRENPRGPGDVTKVYKSILNGTDNENDNENVSPTGIKREGKATLSPREKAPKIRRFTPPTIPEIKAYCADQGIEINAEHFYAYYSAAGWKRGNTFITDWKALVNNWKFREGAKHRSNYTFSAMPEHPREPAAALVSELRGRNGNII